MFRPLLSGLAVIFLTALTLPAQEWARKLLETTEHDFGSVARGAKAEYAFVVTNYLQGDVHIASVRSSCGCTSPYVENDKRTLKTYEKTAIIAHLNSDTHVGQRAATLTVTFDQPQYAEVQLQIRAFVHTDILMGRPAYSLASSNKARRAKPGCGSIAPTSPIGRSARSVRLSDPNLHGELVLLARQGGQVWYDLKVRLAPTASTGYISDRAMLTTNDPGMGPIFVQVEGQVRPNVVVSPADLFLGVVQAGQRVTKPLVVRADRPFRIKAITGDKASFEIPKPPGDSKSVHVVPVTFIAGAEIGKVVKTIHIDTDIGDAQATSYAVVNEEK